MRRRTLITGTAAGMAGAAFVGESASAADGSRTVTIDEALYGRIDVTPMAAQQLDAALGAARADLRRTRYAQLYRRAPNLLAHAQAAMAGASAHQQAAAATRLCHAYSITAQLLLLMHEDTLAAISAERAMRAGSAGDCPIAAADAARVTATVLRRTPHAANATTILLDAARNVDEHTALADAEHCGMYCKVLAAGAYTAALRDDRDAANELLTEALRAFDRSGRADSRWFDRSDVATYHVSVNRVLGDYGTAIRHSERVDPTSLGAVGQQARYWQDTALSLHGRGRTDETVSALLELEAVAPQEIRYRPWARRLLGELLSTTNQRGLRDLAGRVGFDA